MPKQDNDIKNVKGNNGEILWIIMQKILIDFLYIQPNENVLFWHKDIQIYLKLKRMTINNRLIYTKPNTGPKYGDATL